MAKRLPLGGFGKYNGERVCKRIRLWRKMTLIPEMILVIRMSDEFDPDTSKFAGEFEMQIVFLGGGVFSIYVPCVLRDYLKEGCVYIVIVSDDGGHQFHFPEEEPDIILVEVQQLIGTKTDLRYMLQDYDEIAD